MTNYDIFKFLKNNISGTVYTCMVFNEGKIVFVSKKRGVSPLIDLIKSNNVSNGYWLADKVIGKAASLLCIKAGITHLYTNVISSPAKDILDMAGIKFDYDHEVPAIQNRDRTGLCPMEGLSKGVNSPEDMYNSVVDWLSSK